MTYTQEKITHQRAKRSTDHNARQYSKDKYENISKKKDPQKKRLERLITGGLFKQTTPVSYWARTYNLLFTTYATGEG